MTNHDEDDSGPIFRLAWLRDLIPLVAMVVAGLVWGMKLEARYDRLDERLVNIQRTADAMQALLNAGMLPITKERIESLQERIKKLEIDCERKGEK